MGSLPISLSLVSVAQQTYTATSTVTVSLPVMSIPLMPQFSMNGMVITSAGQGQSSHVSGGGLHGAEVQGVILSQALQPNPARLV